MQNTKRDKYLTFTYTLGQILKEAIIEEHGEIVKHKWEAGVFSITQTGHVFYPVCIRYSAWVVHNTNTTDLSLKRHNSTRACFKNIHFLFDPYMSYSFFKFNLIIIFYNKGKQIHNMHHSSGIHMIEFF